MPSRISVRQLLLRRHIEACMLALRVGGHVSLMGGIREDISISYTWIMHNHLAIKGKWVYTQGDDYLLIILYRWHFRAIEKTQHIVEYSQRSCRTVVHCGQC